MFLATGFLDKLYLLVAKTQINLHSKTLELHGFCCLQVQEEEVVNAKSEIRGMFNFQGFFFFIPGLSHTSKQVVRMHIRDSSLI